MLVPEMGCFSDSDIWFCITDLFIESGALEGYLNSSEWRAGKLKTLIVTNIYLLLQMMQL